MSCNLLATVLAMKKQQQHAGVRHQIPETIHFPSQFWDSDGDGPSTATEVVPPPISGEGLDVRWGAAPPSHHLEARRPSGVPMSPGVSKVSGKKGAGGATTATEIASPAPGSGTTSPSGTARGAGPSGPVLLRGPQMTASSQSGVFYACAYEDGGVTVTRLRESGGGAGLNIQQNMSAVSLSDLQIGGGYPLPSPGGGYFNNNSPANISVSAPHHPGAGPHPMSGNSGWLMRSFTLEDFNVPLTVPVVRASSPHLRGSTSHPSTTASSKTNNDSVMSAIANGAADKSLSVVKAVSVVPVTGTGGGGSQFILAVAYQTWGFVMVDGFGDAVGGGANANIAANSINHGISSAYMSATPRKLPQTRRVKITNEFLQQAMQSVMDAEREKEGKPPDDGTGAAQGGGRGGGRRSSVQGGAGASKNNGGVGVAKGKRGMQNNASPASAVIQIDNITLSSCGRYVAVSLTSPGMYVLLIELPPLLPLAQNVLPQPAPVRLTSPPFFSAGSRPDAGRVGDACTGIPALNENSDSGGAGVVVEPERLVSYCVYENAATRHNTISGKTTTELVQGIVSAANEPVKEKDKSSIMAPAPVPMGSVGKTNNEVALGNTCVFSKCFFLHDNAGAPVQLVVVWINSPKYCRLPLNTAPKSFGERVKVVNTPAGSTEERDDKSAGGKGSGRGGEGANSAKNAAGGGNSGRGGAKKGGGGKGGRNAAPDTNLLKKDRDLRCQRFDGVLRHETVAPIHVAAVCPSNQLLAFGCQGGSVHVVSVRRTLATASALPPQSEMPPEWRGVTAQVSPVSLAVQVLPSAASGAPSSLTQMMLSGGGATTCPPLSDDDARPGSTIHVIAGTSIVARGKTPVFTAASLFLYPQQRASEMPWSTAPVRGTTTAATTTTTAAAMRRTNNPMTTTSGGGASVALNRHTSNTNNSRSNSAGFQLYPGMLGSAGADGKATPTAFVLSNLDGSDSSSSDGSRSGGAAAPHKSLFLAGLPSALSGAIMADPLPFALLFLDPYCQKSGACDDAAGPGSTQGAGLGDFGASLLTGTTTTNTINTPGSPSGIRGAHHCLLWDTHYNVLLRSLPFSLVDDCTKPVAAPCGVPAGNASSNTRARVGSIGGGVSVTGGRLGRSEKAAAAAAAAAAVDSMNTSLQLGGEEEEMRVVSLQHAKCESHSVFHSIYPVHPPVPVSSNGLHAVAPVPTSISSSYVMAAQPLTASCGGLLWLQNEERARAYCDPHNLSLTKAGNANNRHGNTAGGGGAELVYTGSHVSDSGQVPSLQSFWSHEGGEAGGVRGSAGAGGGATLPGVRPYFWSFTSIIHFLYPAFLAYFPDASLMQIAKVLHQLSPEKRKDSVALMNASHDVLQGAAAGRLTGRSGIISRMSPQRSPSRPGSGNLRFGSSVTSWAGQNHHISTNYNAASAAGTRSPSVGGARAGPTRGSSSGRLSAAAAERAVLTVPTADSFPIDWLVSVSGAADARRMRLNKALDNTQS